MNATINMKSVRDWVAVLVVAALMTTYPARAQEPLLSRTPGETTARQAPQNYDVLHVNAATGHDQQGLGSAEQPYKTITQALRMAPATSTVILLAPGHYSQDSGEQFPLRLRPGITIQGNNGEARSTIIAGGGEFQTGNRTYHATVLTADRSGIANVAVSNSKGSGIWITTGSPILRRVALISNAVAGVQVTDGAPVIENSYFNGNQYGLSIQGNGRAIIRGNYFEATGRAITVDSPATPIINNNRIARNDVGIALKNNARPLIEANVLDGNGRNGVVEVESAEVASTTAATPAAASSSDALVVKVSEISRESSVSDIGSQEEAAALTQPDANTDDNAREQTVTETFADAETGNDTVLRQSLAVDETISDRLTQTNEPEEIDQTDNDEQILANPSAAPAPITAQERPAILQRDQTSLPEVADVALPTADEGATGEVIPIAVIPANQPEITPSNSSRQEGVAKLLARLNRNSEAASPPATESANTASRTPLPDVPVTPIPASGERLPVPSVAIPSVGGSANLIPPGAVAATTSFRYRVLVDMTAADDLQTLVPDAFRTQVNNRMFMQAGAYVNEAEAQERLDWLKENGIDGRINVRD